MPIIPWGFLGSSVAKKSVCNAGDPSSIPGSGKSSEEGLGYPDGLDGKESTCKVGYLGSIPGLGRSAAGRNGNPLQYSCLDNPVDRGAWRAMVHGVAKSRTRPST